jgi:hypothetical protein
MPFAFSSALAFAFMAASAEVVPEICVYGIGLCETPAHPVSKIAKLKMFRVCMRFLFALVLPKGTDCNNSFYIMRSTRQGSFKQQLSCKLAKNKGHRRWDWGRCLTGNSRPRGTCGATILWSAGLDR